MKKTNKCIDCGERVSKKNIKRCRPCSDIARRKEPNKCIDCKIIISKYSERCNNCRAKYYSGKKHPNWTGGPKYSNCTDCNKKTRNRYSKRCIFCYKKSRYIEMKNCIDCGVKLKSHKSKRCRSCRAKNSRIEKPNCINCGKKLSRRDAKRCTLCYLSHIPKNTHKQNKPEKYLQKVLKRIIPKEYKYVGNNNFYIECYNPDFINVNGQKKIIEFFGDYWHTIMKGCKERDKRKIKTYKKYGYDCLVIRTKDLKSKNLENRILNFNNIKK